MRQARVMGTAALVLAVAVADDLGAQGVARPGIVEVGSVKERTRAGFWITPGLMWGGAQTDLDGDGRGFSNTTSSVAFKLALGGTPSDGVRLGGEVSSWIDESDFDGLWEATTTVQMVAQLYPLGGPFFVKGGLGFGTSSVWGYGSPSITDWGFAGTIGGGFEIAVSRNVFLTPTVDWTWHNYPSDIELGYRERLLLIGMGVTFQSPGR